MSHHSHTVEEHKVVYSAKVIAESNMPSNMVRMSEPDACGIIHGCCGDTMEFFLRFQDGRIGAVSFLTDGCESAIACGSMLGKMVEGMSLEEAGSVQPEDVVSALDGLPGAQEHCAKLAVNTLRQAIEHGRG